MEINREHRSPNNKPRPAGVKPTVITIHASAGKSDAGDVSWCMKSKADHEADWAKAKAKLPKEKWPAKPSNPVSYHYLVGRDGEVYELVDPKAQAWHAGESEWKGRKFCNQFSIGVSWANRHDQTEFLTGAQLKSMRELIDWLCERYPTITALATHADVSPGRKTDPDKCPNFHKADWVF